jgi:hypothetical protein
MYVWLVYVNVGMFLGLSFFYRKNIRELPSFATTKNEVPIWREKRKRRSEIGCRFQNGWDISMAALQQQQQQQQLASSLLCIHMDDMKK